MNSEAPQPGSHVPVAGQTYIASEVWFLARCISPSWSESRLVGGEHYGVRLSKTLFGVPYFFVIAIPHSSFSHENFFERGDMWLVKNVPGFEPIGEFSGVRFELVRTPQEVSRAIAIMKTRKEYLSGEYRKHDSPKS